LKLHPFKLRALTAFEQYSSEAFLKDVGAGVSVGFVVLPLAMAFAISSGLTPEAGLFTSIVAGVGDVFLGRQPVTNCPSYEHWDHPLADPR
jgi:sulfate permease, SulP family